jgi:hypothetical protein
VSDSHPAPSHSSGAPAVGQVVSTPEFDAREIEQFGEKDGQAIRVIGKMLVLFFFYSLVVMLFVGYWTRKTANAPAKAGAHHGEHAVEDDDE